MNTNAPHNTAPAASATPPDTSPDVSPAAPLPHHLHDISEIYLEPAVENYQRGREIMARYPNARRIEVASHWRIPELHGNADLVQDWNRVKREVLVLGARKSFQVRENGRSADFIAPGEASGCALACAYCVQEGTLISTPQGQVPVLTDLLAKHLPTCRVRYAF